MVRSSHLWLGLSVALFAQHGQQPCPAAAGKLEYNRDIRPILAENCFACHGPDSAARKAELRLDKRDDAVETAPSCPASRTRATSSSASSRTDTDEINAAARDRRRN